MTYYYDPTIDHHHRLPVGRAGLFPAYFLAPQAPAESRALFDAVLAHAGLDGRAAPIELPGPQRTPMLVLLAKEWDLAELAASLQQAADEVIMNVVPALGGDGGAIALDAQGNIAMPFNTSGMYRGWVKPDGTRGVAIFRED